MERGDTRHRDMRRWQDAWDESVYVLVLSEALPLGEMLPFGDETPEIALTAWLSALNMLPRHSYSKAVAQLLTLPIYRRWHRAAVGLSRRLEPTAAPTFTKSLGGGMTVTAWLALTRKAAGKSEGDAATGEIVLGRDRGDRAGELLLPPGLPPSPCSLSPYRRSRSRAAELPSTADGTKGSAGDSGDNKPRLLELWSGFGDGNFNEEFDVDEDVTGEGMDEFTSSVGAPVRAAITAVSLPRITLSPSLLMSLIVSHLPQHFTTSLPPRLRGVVSANAGAGMREHKEEMKRVLSAVSSSFAVSAPTSTTPLRLFYPLYLAAPSSSSDVTDAGAMLEALLLALGHLSFGYPFGSPEPSTSLAFPPALFPFAVPLWEGGGQGQLQEERRQEQRSDVLSKTSFEASLFGASPLSSLKVSLTLLPSMPLLPSEDAKTMQTMTQQAGIQWAEIQQAWMEAVREIAALPAFASPWSYLRGREHKEGKGDGGAGVRFVYPANLPFSLSLYAARKLADERDGDEENNGAVLSKPESGRRPSPRRASSSPYSRRRVFIPGLKTAQDTLVLQAGKAAGVMMRHRILQTWKVLATLGSLAMQARAENETSQNRAEDEREWRMTATKRIISAEHILWGFKAFVPLHALSMSELAKELARRWDKTVQETAQKAARIHGADGISKPFLPRPHLLLYSHGMMVERLADTPLYAWHVLPLRNDERIMWWAASGLLLFLHASLIHPLPSPPFPYLYRIRDIAAKEAWAAGDYLSRTSELMTQYDPGFQFRPSLLRLLIEHLAWVYEAAFMPHTSSSGTNALSEGMLNEGILGDEALNDFLALLDDKARSDDMTVSAIASFVRRLRYNAKEMMMEADVRMKHTGEYVSEIARIALLLLSG